MASAALFLFLLWVEGRQVSLQREPIGKTWVSRSSFFWSWPLERQNSRTSHQWPRCCSLPCGHSKRYKKRTLYMQDSTPSMATYMRLSLASCSQSLSTHINSEIHDREGTNNMVQNHCDPMTWVVMRWLGEKGSIRMVCDCLPATSCIRATSHWLDGCRRWRTWAK